MRTISEYVAARRAKWRTDTESTVRFEATFYRNRLTKDEKRRFSKRERVPVELIGIDCLDELELAELLVSRIKTEIAQLTGVANRLKASGVKLRRSKQIKIDLAVLRAEREWLTGQSEAIRVRCYEKNTKFADLREKLKKGELTGEFTPIGAKRPTGKRQPTLAEQTVVFKDADETAAYIAAREKGEWQRDESSTVDFEKTVYREKYTKEERGRLKTTNPTVPKWFMEFRRMTERQLWQLRVVRATELLGGLKAQYAKRSGKARRQTVANIRAVVAEIAWLRHKRDASPAWRQGEWDAAFTIRWEEHVKAQREERARRAKARAERTRKKYATVEERKAAQSAISRRYRERKALAAGKPMPRHNRKYATAEERYQAILASNRESARRRKEREERGELMPRRGVVEGFSFPHKARRGPMIVERKYASWWGRDEERKAEGA